MKENETLLKLKYFKKIIKMKESFYFTKVNEIMNYQVHNGVELCKNFKYEVS